MRIAIITDYHNKTGIGKQNYQLYQALLNLGHEAEIIHLVSKQGFSEPPKYGVNIISRFFLLGVFWGFRVGLTRHFANKKYDIVLLGHQGLAYLHNTLEHSGIPYALTIFDLLALYKEYTPWWDLRFVIFNTFLLRHAKYINNIVFSSRFTKNDYERFFHHCPDYTAVIPIGITSEISEFIDSKKTRDWKSFFTGKRIVLQVGSFDKRKNAPTFFAIAHKCENVDSFMDIIFVRVGKTPDEWKYNASSNMVFLQNLSENDLFALYRYASVFIFTSWHEGYGMPVAEARSVGLPVISTKISDMPDLFSEDPGVFFVNNPNDSSEYMNNIHHILMGGIKKIPSPVIKDLDTHTEAQNYVSFFHKLLNHS